MTIISLFIIITVSIAGLFFIILAALDEPLIGGFWTFLFSILFFTIAFPEQKNIIFFIVILVSLGLGTLATKFFSYLESQESNHTAQKKPKTEVNKTLGSKALNNLSSEATPIKSTTNTKVAESDFDYEDYYDGHTESTWESIGLSVARKHRSYGRVHYTFLQTEPKISSKYSWLSPNQRKVKILGEALLNRTGSKYVAKEILVNQYNFKEATAKYAVGYEGFYDW